MGKLNLGDIVARKSYDSDIFFKIVAIQENVVTLKGICYRIEADAPISDLILQSENRIQEYNSIVNTKISKKCNYYNNTHPFSNKKKDSFKINVRSESSTFFKSGKVLHLDGDPDYLNNCIAQYEKLGIPVVGKFVPEKDQPATIFKLLQQYTPDILVLTGHDGIIKTGSNFSDINNYRNSKYFINAVREARRFEKNLDSLVIFAGACQSLYLEIINAGANFASSPGRVLIHALDPVFICQKITFTGSNILISPSEAINATLTGSQGIGGIETRGMYRIGYPKESFKS